MADNTNVDNMDKFKFLAARLYNCALLRHVTTWSAQLATRMNNESFGIDKDRANCSTGRRLRSFCTQFGIYNYGLCLLMLGSLAIDCLLITSFAIQLTSWTIFALAIVELLRPIIFPSLSNDVEQLRLIDEDHLSVGKCLAYSFYDHYLKHVLPGLHNRVEVYEKHCWSSAAHAKRVVIAKKLIVLVPYSGNVEGYRLVTDADSTVERFGQLEPVALTIAGKPSREYVNTVYHLKNTDVYCVCEFATPLVSLHRMWMSSGASTDDLVLGRQILGFCTKLRDILKVNQREMQDACEIVLYRDLHTETSVADSLAKTVSRIERSELIC